MRHPSCENNNFALIYFVFCKDVLICLILYFQTKTIGTVKRVAESILEEGGFISKIESLGARDLPYRMKAHGQIHSKGRLVLHFCSLACVVGVRFNNVLK